MASDRSFVDYVCEQAGLADALGCKRMFGEYALYLHGRVVGFVCDNQLFVKPTPAGRAVLDEVHEAPPYPGAKPCLLITDELEDRQQLQRLLTVTADALPLPKPKAARKPARKASST